MDQDIRIALGSLAQAIEAARGPIFTDADWGRVLRCFLAVCEAMDHQDDQFKAKAANAARIERAAEKERRKREHEIEMKHLLDVLDSALDD